MTAIPKPFPFETLPQFTHAELALQRRVLKQYSFLESSRESFADFLAPLSKFLPDGFDIELMQVSALNFADFQNRFAHNGLFCLVKVLPQNRFAFLSFDPTFAKFLVTSALTGGTSTPDKVLSDQVRPLTAIEEGVVEYLVVSCLQHMETRFQKKDFSLLFETILTQSPKLTGFFSVQDELAAFSFLLRAGQKDYAFELVVPLTLSKDLGWDRAGETFVEQRLHDFQRFKIDFQLEVGRVELSASEFADLREGDIVLLDESQLKRSNPPQGRAAWKPFGMATDVGYEVNLRCEGENLVAEILGVL